MTDPLAPGDFVVCVLNRSSVPAQDVIARRLTIGRIYTVSEVFVDYVGNPGLNVEGIDATPWRGWGLIFFKPVRRPDRKTLHDRLLGAEIMPEGPVRSEPVKAGAGFPA